MGYQVRVEPSGKTFEVVGGDSLLEAALRAGLPFAYGCSNGHCGQCRARLLAGRVETVRHHDFSFGEAETLAGAILCCAVTAASDLVLEAGEAAGVDQIRPQSLATRLHEVERVDDALALVTLRTPRSQRFRFVAGQRARLSAPGLPPLELGIASCPCDE
ncbi:MAG TPA: 2Fe-2S iron-sulfur cluster-binding protein, partial [Gammaproteobacteria bacterium]